MIERDTDRYDRTTIVLHWMTAALVAALWLIGQTADWIPDDSATAATWSVHVSLGFALAAVLIYRVVWRSGRGRSLPAADTGATQAFATATHYLLYVMLVAVVGLGIANAFVRGYYVFGLELPQIGAHALRRPITHWHGVAADAVLVLALFHTAAVLVHHYVWRDGLLHRMAAARAADRA